MASSHKIRLQAVWRSRTGRISGRQSTTCIPLGRTKPEHLPPPIDSWSTLATFIRINFQKEGNEPSLRCVLLKPLFWKPAHFDPILQQLRQPIVDISGKTIFLSLPQSTENRQKIADLEAFTPSGDVQIFGLWQEQGHEIVIEPISLIDQNQIIHLGFPSSLNQKDKISKLSLEEGQKQQDNQPPENTSHSFVQEESVDAENQPEPLDLSFPSFLPEPQDGIGHFLLEVWNELESVSSLGISAFSKWHRFAEYINQAQIYQLTHLQKALQHLYQTATFHSEKEIQIAHSLLNAAFLLQTTQRIATLEQAISAFA